MKLRILTWNLWHGLNPYQRLLMAPMESPIARRKRRRRQLEVLSNWHVGPMDLICLQEVNPLRRQLRKFSNGLAMRGDGCIVNAGVKIGGWGVPPLLEEGLAIFAGEDFGALNWGETTLSGNAREVFGPFGLSLIVQLQERRKALLFEGQVQGKRVAVVNLHLHHGPDTIRLNRDRKSAEVHRLTEWLEPRAKDWDLLLVCGDFNCDPDSTVVEPLLELGLVDTAKLARSESPFTWNPGENPLAGRSSDEASTTEARDWDGQTHAFDRIYVRSSEPIEKVALSMLREPELSDHFGLSAEISTGP